MFDPTEDQPGLLTGLAEMLAGLVFFPLIFYLVQFFFRHTGPGKGICRRFSLRSHGILDIANKATSTTFAVLACSTGLKVMSGCGAEGGLDQRFYILDNYLIFGVSYFIYDVASMYLVHSTEHKEEVSVSLGEFMTFLSSRPMIVLHHLLVPLLGFPVLMVVRGGQGDCLLGASFLIEASTPFVSLRVVLVHFKMKESRAYFINGLLMLFSFLLCRVLLFPFLYLRYSHIMGMDMSTVLLTTPVWVHLLVIGLWTPQLLWFNRMLRGSLKIIRENAFNKNNKIVRENTSEKEKEEVAGEIKEAKIEAENLVEEDDMSDTGDDEKKDN